MKQSEPDIAANRTQNGTVALLAAARQCRRLSRRVRVPKTSSWSGRIAAKFRDGVESELIDRRGVGKLTAADYAVLDSIYFAAAGLAEGYALLGSAGWIDTEKHAFHPAVETILKLQREMKDDLER